MLNSLSFSPPIYVAENALVHPNTSWSNQTGWYGKPNTVQTRRAGTGNQILVKLDGLVRETKYRSNQRAGTETKYLLNQTGWYGNPNTGQTRRVGTGTKYCSIQTGWYGKQNTGQTRRAGTGTKYQSNQTGWYGNQILVKLDGLVRETKYRSNQTGWYWKPGRIIQLLN